MFMMDLILYYKIPVSLHENQGLTLNRGSFLVSARGLREVLREVFEKSAIIFFLNILNLNSGNVHFI